MGGGCSEWVGDVGIEDTDCPGSATECRTGDRIGFFVTGLAGSGFAEIGLLVGWVGFEWIEVGFGFSAVSGFTDPGFVAFCWVKFDGFASIGLVEFRLATA